MSKSLKVLLSIIFLALLAFLILIFSGSKIYTDILWFQHLGFLHTFLVMFFANFWIRIVVGLIFTIFIFINLNFTKKAFINYINQRNNNEDEDIETIFEERGRGIINWLNQRRLSVIYLLGSIILGFLFSSISQDVWKIVLKYLNKTPFGTTDPLFNRDIGFYIFSLPFFNFIKEMGMVLVILTIIIVGIIYILASGINTFQDVTGKLPNRAKSHITILVTLFFFLKAWDYRLSMYDLLYSPRGVVFGASYTDVNANLIGLKILFVIAIAIGIILLTSIFRKNYRVLLYGLGIWILATFLLGNIYPAFIQRFQVEPNEIVKERQYINYNINMTLEAYGLSDIKTDSFQVKNSLNQESLQKHNDIIKNIRLWDSRPILSTYSQLQELRQYYNFINVDIDRYNIDGEYREVLLAAREMDQTLLSNQAKTWINQALKYTHGYGLVMSPVNRVTSEGLPEFFIKDIPPQSSVDLKVDNASIYYGEKTDNYIIANNRSKEFHYPMGSENVYINYEGTGGIQLNNIFKKLLYAFRFSNIKFLLANGITTESRIMYYRNIHERVRKVAPFLQFDGDPYLVVANGGLYWIQDAYTTTNRYPYSQPVNGGINYIRNSIKIVIDAYNGSMKFYVIDESDPLAATYQKIFSDLFVAGNEMPEVFRQHIRYPEDLFVIQSHLYSTYHMKDPTVFYNKEDLWNIPEENYAGNSIQMQPYYIISKLPGAAEAEFILMLPFTPATKNNMVAWMAARSDGENYGELLVYNFPKDNLVYGPMQIESRIDQDAEISQLLTLWSQRGSRVIRGNLLIIPIEDSILYVEPIYLQAETSELPEMKRVIVSYDDNLVMTQTLDQALAAIFGQLPEEQINQMEKEQFVQIPGNISELATRAVDLYNQAQENLKEGNWSQYGETIQELENILKQLRDMSQNQGITSNQEVSSQ